jgi:hypothetical protein
VTSDAIVLLKDDHKEIRRLFREFQRAGEKATKKKARLVGQIIERLTVHTYIENEVVYPEVRALLPELEDDLLESYEEQRGGTRTGRHRPGPGAGRSGLLLSLRTAGRPDGQARDPGWSVNRSPKITRPCRCE